VSKTDYILLGMDNEHDVLLFRHSAHEASVVANIMWLCTEEQIHGYFDEGGIYADRAICPLPSLLFLSDQLNGQPTFELLQWLTQHHAIRSVPVILTTAAFNPEICTQAKTLGALECFGKPLTSADWAKLNTILKRM
jgi:CheY-like chemotaxis protein